MMRSPIVGNSEAGLDHAADPSRAPVAAALVVALVTQLAAPALAWPAAGTDGTAAAADTSARSAAGSAPALAPPPLTREERHWSELVRACSANAKHVRLHFSGRTAETDRVETEAAGVRFRSPHESPRSDAITDAYTGTDTLVSWRDVSKVEVRNVASTSEGAAAGTVAGLAIGLPVAIVAETGAIVASIFSFRQQHSSAGVILLGAAALGLTFGAVASRHPHGGWVTCCERDTSAATPDAAALH